LRDGDTMLRIADSRGIMRAEALNMLEMYAAQDKLEMTSELMAFILRGHTAEEPIKMCWKVANYLSDAIYWTIKNEVIKALQWDCAPDELLLTQSAINDIHSTTLYVVHNLLKSIAKAHGISDADLRWCIYDEISNVIPVEPKKERGK